MQRIICNPWEDTAVLEALDSDAEAAVLTDVLSDDWFNSNVSESAVSQQTK